MSELKCHFPDQPILPMGQDPLYNPHIYHTLPFFSTDNITPAITCATECQLHVCSCLLLCLVCFCPPALLTGDLHKCLWTEWSHGVDPECRRNDYGLEKSESETRGSKGIKWRKLNGVRVLIYFFFKVRNSEMLFLEKNVYSLSSNLKASVKWLERRSSWVCLCSDRSRDYWKASC